MRRISITLISLLFLSGFAANAQSKKPAASSLDAKVDALIAKMTLEEKVGQMTQVTLDEVSKINNGAHQVDADKLKDATMKYHVGSILNVMGAAYTREHWHEIISAI